MLEHALARAIRGLVHAMKLFMKGYVQRMQRAFEELCGQRAIKRHLNPMRGMPVPHRKQPRPRLKALQEHRPHLRQRKTPERKH